MERRASSVLVEPRRFDFDQLHRLQTREFRDKTGHYLIEGIRFVTAARDAPADISQIFYCREELKSSFGRQLVRRLQDDGVPGVKISREQFLSLNCHPEAQGMVAVVRQSWVDLSNHRSRRDSLWVGIDVIRSGGNLGTIMRTAEAVGAEGLLVLSDLDVFEQGVLRGSMGAHLMLKLARASPALARKWIGREGFRCIGTSGSGAVDYRSVSYKRRTLLMLGDERKGLTPAQRSLCDGVVKIPMAGWMSSLNVAMAAAVLLYEAYSQRHPLSARKQRS